MTDRLMVESNAFYPAPRDLGEVYYWVAWCNATPWGTNTTAVNTTPSDKSDHTSRPTPTPTNTPTNTSKMLPPQLSQPSRRDRRKDAQPEVASLEREHSSSSQPGFSSAQPRVSVLTPIAHDMSERTGSIRPIPIRVPSVSDTNRRQSRPNPSP